MSEPILRAENVSFIYDQSEGNTIPALKNINLSIEKGSFVAVLGHNGSGKSTLAKLFNLILLPTEGSVFIEGKNVTKEDISEDELFEIRRKIGMVFQNPDNQLVATVVEEDIAFGPENLGLPSSEIRKRVDDALAAVNMSAYALHAPHQLSGGQKQRIAIAGIIALMPDVIIFDESTAMLDPKGRAEVMQTIKKLNDDGITILHITHYMEEAILADRIIVIDDGEILFDDIPEKVFANAEKLKSVGLDVPQSVEIVNLLKKDGFCINSCPLTPETAAQCIDDYIKSL